MANPATNRMKTTNRRRLYRACKMDINEINRVFQEIGIRLDQVDAIEQNPDMKGREIVNLANAKRGSDAVNLSQLEYNLLTRYSFFAYDAAGGIDFTAGFTDITLDTNVTKGDSYSFPAGSAEITITEAGWYSIKYFFSSYMTAFVDKTTFLAKMQLNSGAGYADIAGSFAGNNHRVASEEKANCGGNFIKELGIGNKIKLLANRASGSSSIETLAAGVGILIEKIAGL